MEILKVRVDAITNKEATAKIASFLTGEGQYFVATPNPEIILYAHKYPEYREILNKSDLSLPDGVGLMLVSRLMGQPLPERISGADMVPQIASIIRDRQLTIALVGSKNQQTIEKADQTMRKWGNEIVFADYGVSKENWNNPAFHEKIIEEMRATKPQIVFVGFGHPKQEQWIEKYRSSLPTVRLFVGCGGTLDFIGGRAKRAPLWMRKIGLEWLWRLITDPKRIKRIFNAVIVFPLTVLYASFRK